MNNPLRRPYCTFRALLPEKAECDEGKSKESCRSSLELVGRK